MRGPLTGIKVLDLSAFVAGPLCGSILADYGAKVIKIERPDCGDLQREVGSRRNDMSGFFQVLNRGKRSLAIDLTSDVGKQVVHKIARQSDVLLHNFRPGVTQRLGIDYDSVRGHNERLVYLSISGFGADGPRHTQRAYDPIIQFMSGIASSQGGEGKRPVQVRQLLIDKLTAHTGAQAVMAALVARASTGKGQLVEVSMLDVAIGFIWSDAASQHILQGEDIETLPPSGAAGHIAEFADGWGVTFALSDTEFQNFLLALNLDHLIDDPRIATIHARMRNRDFLVEVYRNHVVPAARKLSLEDAEQRFLAYDVPFAAAQKLVDLPEDAQVRHSGSLRRAFHPRAGEFIEARLPALFSQTPALPTHHAPSLGEHTREVLEELGYSAATISAWHDEGLLAG